MCTNKALFGWSDSHLIWFETSYGKKIIPKIKNDLLPFN